MTGNDRPRAALARSGAALALVWAAVFAVLHLSWAVGGRAFIGSSPQAEAAFARPAFAIYNSAVAVCCVLGAAAAVALLAAPRPPRGVVQLARVTTGLACVVLLLRGGVGIVQDLVGTGPSATQRAAYDFDPWFLLGGALFGLATACHVHKSNSSAQIDGRRQASRHRGVDHGPG